MRATKRKHTPRMVQITCACPKHEIFSAVVTTKPPLYMNNTCKIRAKRARDKAKHEKSWPVCRVCGERKRKIYRAYNSCYTCMVRAIIRQGFENRIAIEITNAESTGQPVRNFIRRFTRK